MTDPLPWRARRTRGAVARLLRRATLFALALVTPGCADDEHPAALVGSGEPWPEADALFHQDPRWLGGDGAASCALSDDRVLWLFGDSFVAKTPAHVRTESALVRNTVAIQTGRDPTSATMAFAWTTEPDGDPGPVFPNVGETWHWPGACARLPEGPLLVFLMVQRPSEGGLGFASAGFRVARIDDPDAPVAAWKPVVIDPPEALRARSVGSALVLRGDRLLALETVGDAHEGKLVSFATAALAAGTWGDWAAFDGDAYRPGAGGTTVLDDAGAEASLHPWRGVWLHAASRGFGATTIAIRTAPTPEGPWSDPTDVYRPPESDGPAPFVYAAKTHPELAPLDGTLAATYATNSFTFADLFTETGAKTLYWPRFVRLRLTSR